MVQQAGFSKAGLLEVLRRAIGTRRDWPLRMPPMRPPRPGRTWIGPVVIVVSVLVTWPAFAGARGEDGSASFGLFVGGVSILLMAWSFILSLRLRMLEPAFGGLDSMYRSHRWTGTLAVVAMYLHTSVEAEIEGGIPGASERMADAAEDLVETGQVMLYVLVIISLIRWIPYRYWRLTHKFLGVPFAFACWHMFVAEKPFANGSGWGRYFVAFMVAGLAAYLGRVVGYDMVSRGRRYRVVGVDRHGSTTEVRLAPLGRRLEHKVAQFAVVKLQVRGMSEPHIFTIASAPHEPDLRFYIRNLGDWTKRVQQADLVGSEVRVEGPYGEFAPLPDEPAPTYWIAGGVGITPFLSATETLEPAPTGKRPTLLYCVRSRDDAMASELLERAAADGRIHLEWFESSAGRRFDRDGLDEVSGGNGLAGAHVAVCGPVGLVSGAVAAARALGADHVETEDFDIRSGVGPDLSTTVEELLGR